MAVSSQFGDFLKEQMAGFGEVSLRRMFGGMGVYHGGLMFALVDDDVLYLKTDDEGREAFRAEGLGPFTYATKTGENQLTSYWRAPARCLDDADEMAVWCRSAHGVAVNAAGTKSRRRRA